jgi:hypothetical protein
LVIGVMFVAGFAWRDAPPLKLLALGCATLTFALAAHVSTGSWARRAGVLRYAGALALGALHAWTAAVIALADATRFTSGVETGRTAQWRSAAAVARGLVIATPLVVVFGALFMSADAVFAELVANVFRFDFEWIASHILPFSILAWLSTGYLRGFLTGTELPPLRVLLGWNPRCHKSLDHVALDPPCHRADEAFGRWRRVGGADLQDLRNQRRIAGNPVPHHHPAAGSGHPHHFPGHVERPGRKHGSEDADDEVEALIGELAQIVGIAFLEPAVRQALCLRAPVPGFDEIARDVDAEDVSAEPGRRQGRRPVATSQVQHLQSRGMPSPATTTSPLSRMLAAMRVKSPFSHDALFGFIERSPLRRMSIAHP